MPTRIRAAQRECGCHDGTGIQAIGQEAKSEQGALAASLAAQAGASNTKLPCAWTARATAAPSSSRTASTRRDGCEPERAEAGRGSGQAGGGGIAIQAIGQ